MFELSPLAINREAFLEQMGVTTDEWEMFKKLKASGELNRDSFNRISLLDALDECAAKGVYLLGLRSNDSRRQYAHNFAKFRVYVVANYPEMTVDEVGPELLMDFLCTFGNGRVHPDGLLSSSTARQRLAVLKKFFNWSVRKNYVRHSPLDNPEIRIRSDGTLHRPAILDRAQAFQMFNIAAKSRYAERNKVIIAFFLHTGARLAEAVRLKEDDIDLKRKVVRLIGKGGKMRYVPMIDPLPALLRDYLEYLPSLRRLYHVPREESQFVFYNCEGPNRGRRIGRRAIQSLVERLVSNMGLPKSPDVARITVHKLRHTYAVSQLQAGISLIQLRDALGHASIETTCLYLRAMADDDLAAKFTATFPVTPNLEHNIRRAKRMDLRLIERIDEQ